MKDVKELAKRQGITEEKARELLAEAERVRDVKDRMLAKVRAEKGPAVELLVRLANYQMTIVHIAAGLTAMAQNGVPQDMKEIPEKMGSTIATMVGQTMDELSTYLGVPENDVLEAQELAKALVSRITDMATSAHLPERKEAA